MWFYVAILAAVIALAADHGPKKTPRSPVIDQNQYLQNCMTGGRRVGDCYADLLLIS